MVWCGKYFLVYLDCGVLLLYLGMLGSLLFVFCLLLFGVYDYFELDVSWGCLCLYDFCWFGVVVYVVLLDDLCVCKLLVGLG